MKNKLTVLIIDDHLLIREAWVMLLNADQRYKKVFATESGEEALSIIRDHKPELVISDINMSPLDGFAMLAQIQKLSPLTKVIAVSMHIEPSYARKMMLGGAQGYVTKNSNSEELLHAIDEVLKGNRYICREVKDILSKELFEAPKINVADALTDREKEITEHIRNGMSSKEIAAKLALSIKTIEVHRHNILRKLGAKNTAALIRILTSNAI